MKKDMSRDMEKPFWGLLDSGRRKQDLVSYSLRQTKRLGRILSWKSLWIMEQQGTRDKLGGCKNICCRNGCLFRLCLQAREFRKGVSGSASHDKAVRHRCAPNHTALPGFVLMWDWETYLGLPGLLVPFQNDWLRAHSRKSSISAPN